MKGTDPIMKLKKLNVALALLSTLCLLAHLGYSAFTYATMYYNPLLTKVFSIPCMVLICMHAVLAMCIVSLQGDGTRDLYPALNRQTVLQRVTAALMFPLLIMHMNTFDLMSKSAQAGRTGVVLLLLAASLIFYGTVLTHIAVSFSKALITLGWLSSGKARKRVDTVAYILCAVLFIAVLLTVSMGQIHMFLG